MLRILTLLLPGLIPSWEFFKAIEPSPRIQWRLLNASQENPGPWQDYRPRPAHLSMAHILHRLFWNPHWNEALYMVSLAERLTLQPTAHSTDEINRLLAQEIVSASHNLTGSHLQFQLVFVSHEEAALVQTTTHVSSPVVLDRLAP